MGSKKVEVVAKDARKAFFTVCLREFTISHGGLNDLTHHEESDIHKKAVLATLVHPLPHLRLKST